LSGKRLTWHPIIDDYAKYLSCKDRSERTISSYSYQVQRLLEYTGKEPEALTQEDLDEYKLHLKETPWAPGKMLDRNSYIPISGAINHLMDMLKKKECKFTAAPARTKPVTPLTIEEVGRIIKAARKTRIRDYALLCSLFYGALRISDALNLDIDNIDFERKKIMILDSKGGYSAEINLHEIALNAIREYIDTERKKFDFQKNQVLFISEKTGERLRVNSIWKTLKDYAVEANITKRVNTHIYRHSFITYLAENEMSLPLIMKHSRHKDPKSAMKYIHVQEGKVQEAYNRIAPDIFSGDRKAPIPQPVKVQPTISHANNNSSEDMLQRAFDSLEKGLISEETFKMLIGKIDQNSTKNRDKNNDNLSYFS
jgi:integrase/recombinase XerD